MPSTWIISEEVRQVLAHVTIAGNAVMLPPGQLERKHYEAVNKVLEGLGGKWDRKTRAHLFPSNPSTALQGVLSTGNGVNRQQALQAFYTPHVYARAWIDTLGIQDGDRILEPSAGHGALALAAAAYTARRNITCYEIDPEAASILRGFGFPTVEGDFLAQAPMACYAWVIMNPPFTKGADIAHVTHACKFLVPGGRLEAIMSAGVRTNTQKKYEAFRRLVDANAGTYTDVPPGTFKASGTNVNTLRVSLRKAA